MIGAVAMLVWLVGVFARVAIIDLDKYNSADEAGMRCILWPLDLISRAPDLLQLPPGEAP